ncbi:carbon-nitrogen hydrolase family protein [Lichenicola sp.]|uniref:carbon-nitrogen hydrolase family protein n=1 Tax=Lichenicola sp. TaxID=2804529 RepID=UPI003AFF761E
MRASVIQMSPGSDKTENISKARALLEACIAKDRPDLVVLPEMWACLGGDLQSKYSAAEDIPATGSDEPGGAAFEFLKQAALANGIFVHGGSIGERAGNKLFNTSLVFSPAGQVLARYRKIHLFDITTPSGAGYKESDTYLPGTDVVSVPIGGRFGTFRVGLAICYDIRFGELFHKLRSEGADVIVLPAAFTSETGEAHWETLLRARAIETQCWFAAAATTGQHLDGRGNPRTTFGHSMIVDPWGTVTATASDGPGWTSAMIDTERTARIRANMPIIEHRRLV